MLKLEQLDYKISSGKVKPGKLAPDDPDVMEYATQLLAVYTEAAASALHRNEVGRLAGQVVKSARKSKLGAGLNKLLLDRCSFAPAHELDYPLFRREKLLESGRLLKSGKLSQGEDNFDLYGDLPDFETIASFDPIAPDELIHRYNMAQAQGLLLSASKVEVTITSPDVSELRRTMKAVKFFRLFARFFRKSSDTVLIEISGPYSIFGPVTKYALSLASLLPVISRLKKWSLSAEVRCKDKPLLLKLSEKSGLLSRSRSFSSYVPGEIRLYHKLFAEKSTEWKIVGDTPFIDAGQQELLFPDLSFYSETSRKSVHLELFHRWHAGQLSQRLALLHDQPELPLIIGIDRAIAADDEALDQLLEPYPELKKRCWLFRDFPGVENSLRVLKRFTAK